MRRCCLQGDVDYLNLYWVDTTTWYVVSGDVTIFGLVTVNVHLILANNATFTVSNGINFTGKPQLRRLRNHRNSMGLNIGKHIQRLIGQKIESTAFITRKRFVCREICD